MRRRKKRDKEFEKLEKGIFALLALGLLGLWFGDRTQFYLWVGGIVIVGVVIIVVINKFNKSRTDKWFFSGKLLKNLQTMNPYEFEEYVAELYKRLGYKTETVGGTHDGGIDVVVTDKNGIKHYIQCKKYITSKVGSPDVRDFYGAIAGKFTEGKGIFITTNIFTSEAELFAKDKQLELIDGSELVRLIKKVGGNIEVSKTEFSEAKCPECGNKLIIRTGKFEKFLGCSAYPKCGYTRDIK